jgi:hypothetical protein
MEHRHYWKALAAMGAVVCGASLVILAITRRSPPVATECDLCGDLRLSGSALASGPDRLLWVCTDCQHKLGRHVDAGGVLGG